MYSDMLNTPAKGTSSADAVRRAKTSLAEAYKQKDLLIQAKNNVNPNDAAAVAKAEQDIKDIDSQIKTLEQDLINALQNHANNPTPDSLVSPDVALQMMAQSIAIANGAQPQPTGQTGGCNRLL